MSGEKISENRIKYSKVVVGVFIFNDKCELFLMKSPKWQNQYVCPGGAIELNETIKDAVEREVKEETNMDIEDIELLAAVDGLGLEKVYSKPENHLIFLDHRAKVKKADKIKLNSEGTEYKWLEPQEWLKRKDIEKYTKKVIKEYLLNEENFKYKYKRALADYQNLIKQTAMEKQEFAKFSNEQMFLEILPVYDNLKLALKHAEKAQDNTDAITEGVKYVLKQFKDALKNMGVEEIETVGKKFDHHIMEAIEGKGEKVIKEVRQGYKLNGKVIAPAKVVVA
ncbi:MAG: nucleotide exchange factor GrpE [Patescibacteria group bacterium]|nr:nucleotide exchange factor GrpE [Patescibacteria group bacterium]